MLIGTLILAIILINLIILIITQNIPSVTKHQMALKIFSSTLVPVPTLISYQYSLNYPFKKKVKILSLMTRCCMLKQLNRCLFKGASNRFWFAKVSNFHQLNIVRCIRFLHPIGAENNNCCIIRSLSTFQHFQSNFVVNKFHCR